MQDERKKNKGGRWSIHWVGRRTRYKTKQKQKIKNVWNEIYIQGDYYLKNGGGDKIKNIGWILSTIHYRFAGPSYILNFPPLSCVSAWKKDVTSRKKKKFSFFPLFSLGRVRWFINTIIYRRRGRPRPTAGFTADGPWGIDVNPHAKNWWDQAKITRGHTHWMCVLCFSTW